MPLEIEYENLIMWHVICDNTALTNNKVYLVIFFQRYFSLYFLRQTILHLPPASNTHLYPDRVLSFSKVLRKTHKEISPVQSEASIQVTWSVSASHRPVLGEMLHTCFPYSPTISCLCDLSNSPVHCVSRLRLSMRRRSSTSPNICLSTN